jgi:hypothetical protein
MYQQTFVAVGEALVRKPNQDVGAPSVRALGVGNTGTAAELATVAEVLPG